MPVSEPRTDHAAQLDLTHRLRRMSGRDPHEVGRATTPLELLFDLTFVIAFGVSAAEFAHQLAGNHLGAGLAGFALSTFAVCWAWINFSWFASAYDTDDWAYRLTTMLQMVGVLILALGIPPGYASIQRGEHVDNRVMVAGYVVMRIAMVFQWLRAARQDPSRRRACLTYAATIVVAQIGWIVSIFIDTSVPATFAIYAVLIFVELLGPWIAERRGGGTPWHAHHIAERYSLLVIIALGEGVVGTVASLGAVVSEHGWTADAVLVAIAGTGLTFGMWWLYFAVPAGALLHAHRQRSFQWGYGHLLLFGAVVATGAGLHSTAYYISGESQLSAAECVLAVAIPVGLYVLGMFVLYAVLVRTLDWMHLAMLAGAAAVLGIAVLLALSGVDMALCHVVVMLAPLVPVLGFEVTGHRRIEHAGAPDQS